MGPNRMLTRSSALAVVAGAGARRVWLQQRRGLRGQRDQGRQRDPDAADRGAERRQARRHADRAQPHGLRTASTRGRRTSTSTTRSIYADPAPAVLLQAEHVRDPEPRHGLGARRRSPQTARRSRCTFARACTSARPSTAKSPRPTSPTRSSAAPTRTSPTPTSQPTSARSKGEARRPAVRFPGITTPDSHTIVFHLTEPKAPIVLAALVLPLSAPVPEEYAKQYDATETDRIRQLPGRHRSVHVQVEQRRQGARASAISPASPRRSCATPTGVPATDFRPAYLNQINIQIGGDPTVIGRQVLEGSDMVQNETPAQPIVKLAYEKFRSQLEISPGAGRPLHRGQQPAGPVLQRQRAQGVLGGARPLRR